MKIVIVGPAYPYRGGIATFNECIARQYQKEGEEVEIETFTLQYPNFLFPGKTQYSVDPAPEGLHIHRSLNSVNPFSWIQLGKKLRKMAPDIVVVRYWMPYMAPCMGTVARIVRKNKKTKVVGFIDNMIPHEHHPGDTLLSQYFTASVDSFLVMSQTVLDDLAQFDTVKPRVMVPHPIYDHYGQLVSKAEAAAHLGLNPTDKFVLFFGFIRDYKGLDLLMQAYADARIQAQPIRLVVAGEFYNNEHKYHELEAQLGLTGKIAWHTEFIPNEEVPYYFSLADVVVQPYKTATQSGITQMAYHFEKPMIVTAVGGLPEMVPDGKVGYVVPVDAHEVANALVQFFATDQTEHFRAGLQDEKKKYGWDRITKAIQELGQSSKTASEVKK